VLADDPVAQKNPAFLSVMGFAKASCAFPEGLDYSGQKGFGQRASFLAEKTKSVGFVPKKISLEA
jgi:hypothetical protein